MSLGSSAVMPWNLGEEASLELLKAAYGCGINTWDTANSYGNGLSEELIGKALRSLQIPRQKVIIMSKVLFHVGEEPDVFGCACGEQLRQARDYVNQGGKLTLVIIPFLAAPESQLTEIITRSLKKCNFCSCGSLARPSWHRLH